jgi:NAD(P)-dependent dehydrogenase (short-subunit alcohol dehydrogenase family)
MAKFQDSAVVVTGSGTGIGYEICRQFAAQGAFVALNDINQARATEGATQINREVGMTRVTPYCFDVADMISLQSTIQAHAADRGRLDIVIANAGLTNYGPFLEYKPEAFDRVMAVNLRGSYFTAQYAAQEMIARKTDDGRILLLSSITGLRAFKNLGAYGVSKAGIIHMTRTLAFELGKHGITVNAICPGATLTERTELEDPDFAANWANVSPTGSVGDVRDVAAAALFLASPDAGQITGQNLQVDGGWTISSPLPESHPDMPVDTSRSGS